MITATWTSNKSLIMQEIRQNLKKKAGPGEPSLSKKEANRTWREDVLGIFSEEQRKATKAKKANRKPYKELDVEST